MAPHSPIHYTSVGGAYLGTFDEGTNLYTRYGYDDITTRGTPNGTTFISGERTH